MAKLDDLARERYPEDPDLRDAIVAEARRIGTAGRIESGELSLPGPADAREWFERQQADRARAGGDTTDPIAE